MVLCNDLKPMKSLMEALIELTQANCKLTAEKEELTRAICELTAGKEELTGANRKLQARCYKQSKQLRDMMQQRQLMMEKLDKQELQNSQLRDFLMRGYRCHLFSLDYSNWPITV